MQPKAKFRDNLSFLSNMTYVDLHLEGLVYPSAEHYYQGGKWPLEERHRFSKTPGEGFALLKPFETKKLAYSAPRQYDVPEKILRMIEALNAKFQYPHFAALLIQVPDKDLVEENTWHDNFWGNCLCDKCKEIPGQNKLGKILKRLKYNIERSASA